MITREMHYISGGCSQTEEIEIPCTEEQLQAEFDRVAQELVGTSDAPADHMPDELNPYDYWGRSGCDEIVGAMWDRGIERDPENVLTPAPVWVKMPEREGSNG